MTFPQQNHPYLHRDMCFLVSQNMKLNNAKWEKNKTKQNKITTTATKKSTIISCIQKTFVITNFGDCHWVILFYNRYFGHGNSSKTTNYAVLYTGLQYETPKKHISPKKEHWPQNSANPINHILKNKRDNAIVSKYKQSSV